MSAKDTKENSDPTPETTGHSWDGIEELNNPLPRWWLWTFYATIAFAILWTILYPAWPLVHGATRGLLGYNSREVLSEKMAEVSASHADLDAALAAADYPQIAGDDALVSYARQGGAAIFRTYCSQCHGAGAEGAKGYPVLLDNDWLWGGSYDAIDFTVRHGINDIADDETRVSEMPSFGGGVLSGEEIDSVVNYVMSLSEAPNDAALVAQGEGVFADNCASCHGEKAMGDQEIGAPNLSDSIWLYGGDYASIRETVMGGRKNVMPHWGERFEEAQIKQIVTYVHQLGGGE